MLLSHVDCSRCGCFPVSFGDLALEDELIQVFDGSDQPRSIASLESVVHCSTQLVFDL
jgi:hypothetical protein